MKIENKIVHNFVPQLLPHDVTIDLKCLLGHTVHIDLIVNRTQGGSCHFRMA